MSVRQERWFVRFQGHTLGPLSTDQIKKSIESRELNALDKVASTQDQVWKCVSDHALLAPFLANGRGIEALKPPPSPNYLWKKRKTPPPLPSIPKAVPKPAPTSLEEKQFAGPPARAEKKVSSAKKKKKPNPHKAKAVKLPSIEAKVNTEKMPEAAINLETAIEPNASIAVAPNSGSITSENIQAKKAIETKNDLPLLKETLSLVESLREWSEAERSLGGPAYEIPQIKAPERPSFLSPPLEWPPTTPRPQDSAIKIEVKLDKKSMKILLLGVLVALTVAIYFQFGKKERDLKDSHLPDPSSPAALPSTGSDPIPLLKAPTRPERD